MRSAAILCALVLDRLAGQPEPHPVEWIGALLSACRRYSQAGTDGGAFLRGAAAVATAVAGSASLAAGTSTLLTLRGGGRGRRLAEAVVLQPSLALEALVEAGSGVSTALRVGDLDLARTLVGRHLVGRETRNLPPHLVASAAIESLSENLNDSVVAPACAYLVAGAPAAWAYRAVNTADAMLGYRTEELEWFGKPAARLDDALNFLPARVTALLLHAVDNRPARARAALLRSLPAEAAKTASPNAGWPMAATALTLGVRLEKPGSYVLNPEGARPGPDDVDRTSSRIRRATWTGALLALAFELGAGRRRSRFVGGARP